MTPMNVVKKNHFESLLDLIDIERGAEKEENKKNLDRISIDIRESLGKTVTGLHLEKEEFGVGGIPLLILSRPPADEPLAPFHAMDQGDLVRLKFEGSDKPLDGTLYNVDEYRVSVALDGDPLEIPRGLCQVDLLGSDATYRRMRQAVERVLKAEGPLKELRDVLLGKKEPSRENKPIPHIPTVTSTNFKKQP